MAGSSIVCHYLGGLPHRVTLVEESKLMILTEFLIKVCKYRKN